jgi:hypothetical protein
VPVHNQFYTAQPPGGQQQPFPQGLQLAGPCLPVQVEVPPALAAQLQQTGQVVPAPAAGFALIDTGASVSAVDAAVIQQLNVQPIGMVPVGTAGGPQQQATYPARFTFPGTPLPAIDFGSLLGANLAGQMVPGHQGPLIALLGRDLLQRFVLVYNGPGAMFSLSF